MIFRKASIEDLDRIEEIYNNIHLEESKGIVSTGWEKGIYPTRKTAEEAILNGDMFVAEDLGRIVAAAKIDQNQGKEYEEVNWEYKVDDNQIMVIHTLVVEPQFKGRGYGRSFVDFYENYARKENCLYLRMDTNEKNSSARALYKKMGYKEVEILPCVFNGIEGTNLVFLEKKLV